MFLNPLVSFERFVFVLNFPNPFRAGRHLFSNSLVSFERFAQCSQILWSRSLGLPFSSQN